MDNRGVVGEQEYVERGGRGIKMQNRGGGAEVAVSLIKTVGKLSFLTSKHNWVLYTYSVSCSPV